MRRILCFLYAFFFVFVVPTTSFAQAISISTDTSLSSISENEQLILHVEYPDFYNNQQYYINLAAFHGYTIYVNVGQEYSEVERNRIESKSASTHVLRDQFTRGISEPTEPWNCRIKNELSFDTHNVTSARYTDYYVYGSLAYVVSVYNRYDHCSITYVPHGHKSDVQSVEVPASTTVIQYFGTEQTSDHFYLGFRPPCSCEGYIDCIGE